MLKQILLIVILSIAAILLKNQLVYALDALIYAHNYDAWFLKQIFSNGSVGRLLQDVIALLLVPLIFGLIIYLICRIVKRGQVRHAMLGAWVVWLVLLSTMVAQTGTSTNNVKQMAQNSQVIYAK